MIENNWCNKCEKNFPPIINVKIYRVLTTVLEEKFGRVNIRKLLLCQFRPVAKLD